MIWVLVGTLVAVVVAAGAVASRTAQPGWPVTVDPTWSSIEEFYDCRPDRVRSVELGRWWRSERDAGAVLSLSWLRDTGELVAMRRPTEVAVWVGEGGGTAPPPSGTVGVKVLAEVDLRKLHRLHPHRLHRLPDGLDRLTAALGCPYVPPIPDGPTTDPSDRADPGTSATTD